MSSIRKSILILLIPLLFLQSASASTSDYLVTEHEPVYPGDTVFVYVPIENNGYGAWMTDTVVKLIPANNATNKAIHVLDDAVAIGNLEDWNDMRTAKFKIHIDQNAVEGEYDFPKFPAFRHYDARAYVI